MKEEGPKNISRRKFFKTGLMGMGVLAGTQVGLGSFRDIGKKESHSKKIFAEQIKYPEKIYVPELMQPYMFDGELKNWIDVEKSQNLAVSKFLKSEKYKKMLLSSYREYFPTKKENEIEILVNELINEKIKHLEELKVNYGRIMNGSFGLYDDKRNRNTSNVDTTKNLLSADFERKFNKGKNFSFNPTTPAHEMWHSTNSKELTFAGEVISIYKSLKDCGTFEEEDAVTELTKKLTVNEKGRVTKHKGEYIESYAHRPDEIKSFKLEILMYMDILSKTNPTAVPLNCKFDINTDVFTKDHLEFLLTNEKRIFGISNFTVPGTDYDIEEMSLMTFVLKIFNENKEILVRELNRNI